MFGYKRCLVLRIAFFLALLSLSLLCRLVNAANVAVTKLFIPNREFFYTSEINQIESFAITFKPYNDIVPNLSIMHLKMPGFTTSNRAINITKLSGCSISQSMILNVSSKNTKDELQFFIQSNTIVPANTSCTLLVSNVYFPPVSRQAKRWQPQTNAPGAQSFRT